jgi:hypothetical protein
MIFILSASIAGFTTSSALPSSFAILRFPGQTLSVPNLAFPLRHGWNTLNGRCKR